MDPYRLTPKAGSSTRLGLWKCHACRKQFSVTVGTVFEASHVKLLVKEHAEDLEKAS